MSKHQAFALVICLLGVSSSIAFAQADNDILSEFQATQINSLTGGLWQAAVPSIFQGRTYESLKSLFSPNAPLPIDKFKFQLFGGIVVDAPNSTDSDNTTNSGNSITSSPSTSSTGTLTTTDQLISAFNLLTNNSIFNFTSFNFTNFLNNVNNNTNNNNNANNNANTNNNTNNNNNNNNANTNNSSGTPTNFDSRSQWGSCIGPVRNQGNCGSCWAFGTVESFEDRLCITGRVSPYVKRSVQYLIDCDSNQQGCSGGYPNYAWSFLTKYGTPTEACYPYAGVQKSCPSSCSDGSMITTVKASQIVTYSSVAAVKADIVANGPVETYMVAYQDLYYYNSGIYYPTTNSQVGYHAVKVIGFGTDNGVNYWLVQNSWGTSWGMSGYFKIKAGTCEFDNVDHFVSGTV